MGVKGSVEGAAGDGVQDGEAEPAGDGDFGCRTGAVLPAGQDGDGIVTHRVQITDNREVPADDGDKVARDEPDIRLEGSASNFAGGVNGERVDDGIAFALQEGLGLLEGRLIEVRAPPHWTCEVDDWRVGVYGYRAE